MKIRKIHIYQICFPTSGKCYIGQTCDLKRRMFRHLENKSFVGNALRKYDDWTVEILHTCKSRDEANRTEIEEIRHYNCVAPNGYNLTAGGEGGIQCEKIRKKMSKNHADFSGDKNPNFGNKGEDNPLYGKKNPEHSKKMKGNKFSCGKRSIETCKNISKNHADISGVKNPMKNPKTILKVKISNLKRYILKLEREL